MQSRKRSRGKIKHVLLNSHASFVSRVTLSSRQSILLPEYQEESVLFVIDQESQAS